MHSLLSRPGRVVPLLGLGAVAIILIGCSADVTRFDSSLLGATDNGRPPITNSGYSESHLSDTPPVTTTEHSFEPRSAPRYDTGVNRAPLGRVPTTRRVDDRYSVRSRSERHKTYRVTDAAPSSSYDDDYRSVRSRRDTRRPYRPTGSSRSSYDDNPSVRSRSDTRKSYEDDYSSARSRRDTRKSYRTADAAPSSYDDEDRGSITVSQGDTLYSLARRHNVSVAALKRANGLSSNIIRPGQQLVLPGRTARRVVERRVVERGPRTYEPRTSDPIDDDSTYTVQPGDSLYSIARRTNLSVASLRSWNDISNARRLMPGTKLRLTPPVERDRVEPSDRRYRTARREVSPDSLREPEREPNGRTLSPPSYGARVINRERPSREAPKRASIARDDPTVRRPSSLDSGAKFRWPVRGRIISGFGPRKDGSHNDGIDISVPMGTEIRAAGEGVVAYAGDELKGYGNLVLIRHNNGWVSAYAHAREMLVKRGDKVRRGQVIGRAGKSGAADQPMLHFELRDGAKPVDPRPHLGS